MTINKPLITPKGISAALPTTGGSASVMPTSTPFAGVLRARDAATDRVGPSRQQTAHTAAQQLVASTFIKPVLSKMRHDPFRSKLFHGGQAEDAFGEQLDGILADRISARTDFSLVGAVERQITRTGARASAATAGAAATSVPTSAGVHIDAQG